MGTPYIISFLFLALLSVFLVSAYNPRTWLSAAIIIIGAAFLAYLSATAKDPYSLFHLTLNKLPGDDHATLPRTEWLNMGFWRVSNVIYSPSIRS
jgi:hypothetical protein